MEDIKKIQEFFSKPLEENTTDWPKEVPSRHGDIIFRLVKVMPDRAKYELIDAETGKTWEVGGRVYGTVNQLKASAEDTIKPQGGRQSSQFESVNEAKKKLPKFKNIPSWAKYVAQASDGEWTWYEDTPTMIKFKDGGGAWKQDGNQTYTGVKTNGKDWDKIPTYYNVKNGVITESVNESPDVNSLKKIHDAVLKFLKTKKGVGEVKEFPEFPNRYGDNVSTFSVKYNIEDKYNYDLQEIKIEYSTSRVFIPNKGYFPFKTFNDIKNIINKKSSLKESVNESEQLDEKLITFSNRAPYGQIVFMAGGAGSGKGFAIDNFIDSAGFKVRDVDEMKKAVGKLDQLGKFSVDKWYKKYGKKLSDKPGKDGGLSPKAHVEEFGRTGVEFAFL